MEASMFHDELKERMKKASVKSQKENGFDSGVKVWSIFNKWLVCTCCPVKSVLPSIKICVYNM